MNLSDFHELLEKMLQRQQLPSFLCGVLFGGFLVLLVIRLARGRGSAGLVKELRDQVAGLKSERQRLEEQVQGLTRERDLHAGHAKLYEGNYETCHQRVMELSDECDGLKTENLALQSQLTRSKKLLREARKGAREYSEQLDSITNSDGKIWLKPTNGRPVPFLPLSIRRVPIISLANLKGGVGKTTITANLGAALASEGLRVLMIDLDHQSSLTNLCLLPGEKVEVKRAGRFINALFSDCGGLPELEKCVTRLESDAGPGQLFLAPASEEFDDVENRLMTRWYSGLLAEDARFRLRGSLHSPGLRESYDLVLIDCPPRLTAGFINALAASDYILIPVLLEEPSAEAVPRILAWLKHFQEKLCLELDVLGVVGNKAYPRKRLINREKVVWEGLRDRCASAWGAPVRLFEEIIREHKATQGRFASLDPRYGPSYQNLVNLIRQEIPHARLEPSAVHSLAGAPPDGGGH